MGPLELLTLLDGGAVREAVAVAGVSEAPNPGANPVIGLLRGWYLVYVGKHEQACEALRALLVEEDQKEQPDRRMLAHLLLAIGMALVLKGEHGPGSVLLERALSVADAQSLWLRAHALRFLGAALEEQMAPEAAAARYDAAARIYREIGNDFGAGSSEYGVAAALLLSGQPVKVVEPRLRMALEVLRKVGGPSLAAALAMLATCRVEEDPEEALSLLAEADTIGAVSPLMEADLQGRRAFVELHLEKPMDALNRVEKSLGEVLPGSAVAADLRMIRTRALLALNRHSEAVEDARILLEFPARAQEARAVLLQVAAQRGDREAVDRLLLALEHRPPSPEFLF